MSPSRLLRAHHPASAIISFPAVSYLAHRSGHPQSPRLAGEKMNRSSVVPRITSPAWYINMKKLQKGVVPHSFSGSNGLPRLGVPFANPSAPTSSRLPMPSCTAFSIHSPPDVPNVETSRGGIQPPHLHRTQVQVSAVSAILSEATSSRHQMFRHHEGPKKGVDIHSPPICSENGGSGRGVEDAIRDIVPNSVRDNIPSAERDIIPSTARDIVPVGGIVPVVGQAATSRGG